MAPASSATVATMEDDIARTFAQAQLWLAEELLGHIHAQTPEFFEHLIIDVLLALGYGGRRRDLARRLGRSGDGGVDGVVVQDELGLDVVYFQAKRLRPGVTVPVSDARDFAGSLDAHRAPREFSWPRAVSRRRRRNPSASCRVGSCWSAGRNFAT